MMRLHPRASGLFPTLFALLTMLCGVAQAVPTVVPYSGYLTGADGQPYDGTVTVKASLHTCATTADEDAGCIVAWPETEIPSVVVSQGVLNFELGAEGDTALTDALTDGANLWLEISLKTPDTDEWTTLDPRHRLLSVPYAVSAHDAEQLGGIAAADYALAAELDALLTLETLQSAGYLNAAEMATAGYLTSEVLAEMNLVSADALATSHMTAAEIESYVTTQLNGYLSYTGLGESLSNYVLKTDAVTQTELDSAGYTTLSAVEAHVTSELGAYTTNTNLTTMLADYALSSALEELVTSGELNTALTPYVTNTSLATTLSAYASTAALFNHPTHDELQTELDDYVSDGSLNVTLGQYVGTTQFFATLENYALTSDVDNYTNVMAVAAVDSAGYATEAQLYTDEQAVAAVDAAGYVHTDDQYGDGDAVTAVETAGYALASDIPSHPVTTSAPTSSTINLSSNITDDKTVEYTFDVDAKAGKSHVRVDVMIRTALSIDYFDYGVSPPGSIAAEVTHTAYLSSGFADAPLYTDRLLTSAPREIGESISKGDTKSYSYMLALSEDEIANGTTVHLDLTAKCYASPVTTNIGCSAFAVVERVTITGM